MSLPTDEQLSALIISELKELIKRAERAIDMQSTVASVKLIALYHLDGVEDDRMKFPEDLDASLLHITVHCDGSGPLGDRYHALVSGLWGSGLCLTEQVEHAFTLARALLYREKGINETNSRVVLECATDLGYGVICG